MLRTALALAVGLVLAGCGSDRTIRERPAPAVETAPPLLTPGARSPRIANYQIDARLDVASKTITATQTLTWTNPGTEAVSMLPFHLYMNGFKNETSLFMKSSGGQHRGARAAAGKWGWIDVSSIQVDGGPNVRARARYAEPDETVLELPLDQTVAPGETVKVAMAFEVQLPEVFARTGYKGDFIMVGQWFPKIGVRIPGPTGERWHCEPFHVNTEFFADFGTYDVTLTVPKTHVIAATGQLTAVADAEDGRRTLTYRAEDVHDFAWMADPFMEVIRGTATNELGQVTVEVWARPEQRAFAERHLQAGIGSIEQFSALYVPYPWATMRIISPPPDAAGSAGGMEYPTLVTTAADMMFAPDGVRLPEYVTVHEVGHNWFQGILASNEVEEAWMDEGVNEYADSLVMEALYGTGADLVDRWGYHADTLGIRGVQDVAEIPSPIAIRAPAFADGGAYGAATYAKTGMALRTLENIVGPDRFRAAMKEYARRFAFEHPTGADLWATLEEVLGQELDWFVVPVFERRGYADLRVRSVKCRDRRPPSGVFGDGDDREVVEPDDGDGYRCEVLVVNLGELPVPVDIELRFADGARTVERWDPLASDDRQAGMWHRLVVEHATRVSEVIIDPEEKILLDASIIERAYRTEPDTSATRAAGARVQFWTQTAMQLGGL